MAGLQGRAQRPFRLFVVHAERDRAFRDALETHLYLFQRQRLIQSWSADCITPGEDWLRATEQHLQEADIILLLISADFMASDLCYAIQMERAMARRDAGEAQVIPVIAEPVDDLDARDVALRLDVVGGALPGRDHLLAVSWALWSIRVRNPDILT
jgi:hypothetical protein